MEINKNFLVLNHVQTLPINLQIMTVIYHYVSLDDSDDGDGLVFYIPFNII